MLHLCGVGGGTRAGGPRLSPPLCPPQPLKPGEISEPFLGTVGEQHKSQPLTGNVHLLGDPKEPPWRSLLHTPCVCRHPVHHAGEDALLGRSMMGIPSVWSLRRGLGSPRKTAGTPVGPADPGAASPPSGEQDGSPSPPVSPCPRSPQWESHTHTPKGCHLKTR